jgi:hypothetical protein
MNMKLLHILPAAAFLALAATGSAHADLTYDYTGNHFMFTELPDGGTSLVASLTFDDTVTSNFNGEAAQAITSFSISSGPISFTSASPGVIPDIDIVFVDGNIANWFVHIFNSEFELLTTNNGIGEDHAFDLNTQVENVNLDAPGTWTLVPATNDVPEPASLAVFAAGLVGLGLMRRRKESSFS